MKFQIREAIPTDAPEITRLSDQLGYPSIEKEVLDNLEQLIKDPDHIVFVADLGDAALEGFIHVFTIRRLFIEKFTEVGGLVIDGKVRGRGIGSKLLAESEKWAVGMSCLEVRVRSNIKRAKTKEFYLNQDYTVNKQQRVFMKYLDPPDADNYLQYLEVNILYT